ncbi:phosphatase PAP2 family protein [Sebaldella sp. S0638]|uniref:phosphatase PAP2 family protein n=1 Tax=Sebaldella sp. S0638 TaxID=2957809 RepID=UPI00209FFE0A|nr:phosphatase PAP2 family protein [Sebaldella sp. S0638]MCP1223779.1 phosphatase PAP2 family protein [Sebaldella sp. S0638]
MFYTIDLYVLNLMNNIENPILDIVMLIFSFLGNDGLIWIAVISVMLIFTNSRKYAGVIVLAVPTTMLIGNKVLKNLFDRPRPFHTFPDLRVLVETSGTHSFPSSHTAVAFTVLGIFLFFKLPYRLFIFILSFGIAFSRIYLNVHYFWDIVGGVFLGMGTAYLFFLIYRKINFLYIKSAIIKAVFAIKNIISD